MFNFLIKKIMRKKNFFLGKRCLTFFSVFIAVFASLNVWAQPASEYCRWLPPSVGAPEAALFTWNTEANGDVTVTIISAIEGETPGQTAFRGQGWNDARIKENLWVDVAGGNNWVRNTDNLFFTNATSADLLTITLTPTQTIPDGAKIRYNGISEYKTSLNGNAWPTIEFIFTYGSTKQCPEPAPLPAPANVAVNASGQLTFDAVANATSYLATVYAGSIPYYTEEGVSPSGSTLTSPDPGAYTVKVKAIGDNNLYLNSLESEAVEWTIAGEIPPLDDSEICYLYWDPSGTGAGVGSDDAVVLSWETLENGNIQVTMLSVGGNEAAWRAGSLNADNFSLGPQSVRGTAYLNTANSGNICTISPKAGVTLPSGMSIRYQGNVVYLTTGGTNPNGNLYPQGDFLYTYGTNCASLEREKLAAPTEVAVDENSALTFTEVENAGAYNAFVYVGENRVYQQIPVVSGDVLNFPLPGTFNVRVTAVPGVESMAEYEESEPSDAYVWTVNWQTPATVPASPYCGYAVNPNGTGNSIANNNETWGDHDGTYWSWNTDAEGQIVISIDSAFHPEEYPEPRFRGASGMSINNFRIGGVPGNLLLEKVGGNTGNTQTFKAKEGITFLPGIEITYSGQVEYLIIAPKPVHDPEMPGNIADLYPGLDFNTVYIYGANCSGEATVLPAPENLAIADNALTFDAVTNAVTYKVYVYDAENLIVHTQGNYASGDLIAYNVPGHYTVKVQSIGNAGEYINSGLSDEAAWDLIAALAKPAGLRIDTENKLTFPPVPAAVSYTVTIYDAADATEALETIAEFESGTQLDLGADNYGNTYYVKVQAIGDGDVILNSELSDAYTWNFEEPYVCNLLLETEHALIKGSDAITFPDIANGGALKGTAPYFAPGWQANNNFTFDITDNVVSIHLGDATGDDWQAQFRILPETAIKLKANALYDVKVKVKTSKSTPVYAKVFEYDDNSYTELIARQAIDDSDGKVFELNGVAFPGSMNSIFQILFDFGKNPADVDIVLSDFVICGEEGTVAIQLINPDKISVYPVPAQDVLHVSGLTNAKTVRIVDIAGHAISVQRTAQDAIDVSGLAKGIYILSIDGQTVKFTKN
jgi:hypothetical protein